MAIDTRVLTLQHVTEALQLMLLNLSTTESNMMGPSHETKSVELSDLTPPRLSQNLLH